MASPENEEMEAPEESVSADELLSQRESAPSAQGDEHLMAVMEAIIYVTDEPLTLEQMARALEQPRERVALILEQLLAEYDRPERGLSIREVAGGLNVVKPAVAQQAPAPVAAHIQSS